jgi:hypothetical protein
MNVRSRAAAFSAKSRSLKALGLAMPPTILVGTDEVIE